MPTFKTKGKKPSHYYNAKQGIIPPPICMKRTAWIKDADNDSVTVFKLRSNPSDPKSQIYEMKARAFSTGSAEEFIMWRRDLNKILKGQNVVQEADKFDMAVRVLEGDALAVFEKLALDLTSQLKISTEPSVEQSDKPFMQAIKALATHIFPNNSLSIQKSWLRRDEAVWKKREIATRTWVARLHEINEMLVEFPPHFSTTQKLQEDEFMELLEYGIPPRWKSEMVKQGFVPRNHLVSEFVEFCEKLEYSEKLLGGPANGTEQGKKPKLGREGGNHETGPIGAAKTPQGGKKRGLQCQQSFAESGGTDGCGYHANSRTHTSNQCKVVMSQIAAMQAQADSSTKQNYKPFKWQKTKNNGGKTPKKLTKLTSKI